MDIWDWFKSLRRWWWMIVVFPIIAGGITWLMSPAPKYESSWTVNIYFDDPALANSAGYFDFVFLDDYAELVETGVFGDVIYTRLPEDLQSTLTRDAFGSMVESSRKAHFVEVTVTGDDPDAVRIVAETIEANSQEVANLYLMPPDYRQGTATVNTLDPISEPTLDTRTRLLNVGAITGATLLASIAATGAAEWLRLSYRAKYSAK